MTFQKRTTPTRRLLALLLSWAVLPVPGASAPAPVPASPAARPTAPAADPRWPDLPRLAEEAARRGVAAGEPSPVASASSDAGPSVSVAEALMPAGPAVVITQLSLSRPKPPCPSASAASRSKELELARAFFLDVARSPRLRKALRDSPLSDDDVRLAIGKLKTAITSGGLMELR